MSIGDGQVRFLLLALLLASFVITLVMFRGLPVSQQLKASFVSPSYTQSVGQEPTVEYSIKYETRRHPAVQPLDRAYQASTAMSAKFRSLSPTPIQIWYDDGQGGVENGHLNLGQETTTNTYHGHVFFFTDAHNKDRVLARHKMQPDVPLYVIEDPLHPAPAALKERTAAELKFHEEYFRRTGILWKHYYGPEGPRPPPKLFMWPAKSVGEVHRVTSHHSYWRCAGSAASCQDSGPLGLELEVVSLQPRAFVINDFLSDFEVSHIISLAKPTLSHSSVGDSETGAFESNTRTSSNTWLPRHSSAITETLFRRAADLLRIEHQHLTRKTGAEDLQVVHYQRGQKYDSHHDWGVSGYPESRFLTLLLYLNNPAHPKAGGETSFPKSSEGPIKVHPGQGSAVLFYDLLEDGNGDEQSLHASLPVREGEKWLVNLWVWDPKFHR